MKSQDHNMPITSEVPVNMPTMAPKIEGLGGGLPKPDVENIGEIPDLPPGTDFAASLNQKLDTPHEGIKDAANVGGFDGGEPPQAVSEITQPKAENITSEPTLEGPDLKADLDQDYPASLENPQSEANNTQQNPKTETTTNTTTENADKASEIQTLDEKVKNQTANEADLNRLKELKKDPEKRRQELTDQFLKDPDSLTAEQIAELGKLNNPDLENAEAAEQTQEQLSQEVEDLGTDILTRKMAGEEVSEEDMDKFNQKYAELKTKELTGASGEQVRKAVKELMNRRGNERKSRNTEAVQQKIRELMTLELQLQMVPDSVRAQRAMRDNLKRGAQAAFETAQRAKGPERIKLKQKEYQEYMKVTIANQNIINTIHFAEKINSRRMDLEQQVRAKLGMSNILEWAGAKANAALTSMRIEAADTAFANEK